MAREITKRQSEVLDYIITRIRDDGMPPTIAEIGQHFGIASTNGVNDHLLALEKKGYITRSSKARSIRVTDKASAGLYHTQIGLVPLVGRIAAGSPILADENVEGHIPVSAAQSVDGGFALTVSGDSMIEDGILDGDTIIVDPKRTPRKGDVVVALVEDEATVKHYVPHGQLVELRPANANLEPMFFPAGAVQIQGVVTGLQRRFA